MRLICRLEKRAASPRHWKANFKDFSQKIYTKTKIFRGNYDDRKRLKTKKQKYMDSGVE